ncbi:Protein BIM1 [Astathelohania contejeani]|uniref:Protein BIM1 n=1 Tax=Astathelohania contejeani TaxID=164912 RepID=A0ABQ7HWL7_9MICR|nr:Protein BIM1 [Thelohania contejeani]
MIMQSKSQLLNWINDLLHTNIKSIAELGKGVEYNEIFSIIHSDYPISQINRNPKTELDYFHNLKLLQSFMFRKDIRTSFPIEKMVKCRMQDNLEFTQWLYKYYKNNKRDADNLYKDRNFLETPIKSNIKPTKVLTPPKQSPDYKPIINELSQKLANEVKEKNELYATIEAFEKERDFYFKKLLLIEELLLLKQRSGDDISDLEIREKIFSILYEKPEE